MKKILLPLAMMVSCGQLFCQNLPVARQVSGPLPSYPVIDPGYFQEPIPEKNAQYDAMLLVSRKDYTLQVALLDRQHKVILRRPVKSEAILLSPSSPVWAEQGKPMNNGYQHVDGRRELQGITVWDMKGQKRFELQTGIITFAELGADGSLLLGSDQQLHVYTPEGTLSWKRPFGHGEASFSTAGDLVFASRYDFAEGKTILDILDAANGTALSTWKYTSGEGLRILHTDKVRQQALVTTMTGESTWKLRLTSLKSNAISEGGILLQGAPFLAQWDETAGLFSFVQVMAPGEDGTSEILFSRWIPEQNAMQTQSLGQFTLNDTDYLLPAKSGEYRLKTGNRVITVAY